MLHRFQVEQNCLCNLYLIKQGSKVILHCYFKNEGEQLILHNFETFFPPLVRSSILPLPPPPPKKKKKKRKKKEKRKHGGSKLKLWQIGLSLTHRCIHNILYNLNHNVVWIQQPCLFR